jgi:hypothetical protein
LADVPEGSPIVAYQNIIAQTFGGPSAEFGKRRMEQEAGRFSDLGKIAGTQESRTAAEVARDATAKKLYSKVENVLVTPDDAYTTLLSRPSMSKAVERAGQLAKEAGDEFKSGDQIPVKSLHYVKMAMDDMIKNPERFGIGASEARSIGQTKNAFVSWLENKVPDYGRARVQYAADSRVIDRMNIGKGLQEKLVSATEKETPASFAQAVRNEVQTIKKATGQPRYNDLTEILTPDEVKIVKDVLADVTRKSKSITLDQRTNLQGGMNVAEESRPHGPVLWSRPVSIMNWLLGGAARRAEGKVDKMAAEQMLGPKSLADFLSQSKTPQAQALLLKLINDPRLQRSPIIGAPLFGADQ